MHQANHSYFQGNNAWKWSQENTQMPPTPIPAHPPYPSIPPFWKKKSWVPFTTRTNNKFSFFAFKKRSFRLKKVSCTCAPVGVHGRTRESWRDLDGWPVSQIGKVQNFETRPWKINGFPKLILKGSLSPSGEKGYEDISMPTRQDVTQVLQQLECKIPSFKNGLVFWNGPVRIDPNGKFHLVTTHPSRCTNLSISNVMMPEGTTPLQWKHILSWQVGMKVDLCWSAA